MYTIAAVRSAYADAHSTVDTASLDSCFDDYRFLDHMDYEPFAIKTRRGTLWKHCKTTKQILADTSMYLTESRL